MEKYRSGSSLLAYNRFGPEDGFPLVFLHGATVDHVSMKNSFEPYFTGPGRGYARYYVDLPGHGESDCPFLRAGITDVLSDLGSFLRDKFPRPPCMVGYSMGGFLALKLAETTPFPAMFLVAPPIYTDKKRIKKPPKMEGVIDQLNKEERKSADSRYLLLSVKKNPETLERYRANLTPGFFPARWIYQSRFFNSAIAADLTVNPRKIASATAFLVGQQDLLVGYRDQFELSSKLKFSEYHSFYDCGHFLPIECPQFGSIFLHWLETAAAKCAAQV